MVSSFDILCSDSRDPDKAIGAVRVTLIGHMYAWGKRLQTGRRQGSIAPSMATGNRRIMLLEGSRFQASARLEPFEVVNSGQG
jgi:hypothetical protein